MAFQSGIAWLPAILGVLAICCESTRVMGADHTMLWLSRLCSPLMRLARPDIIELNHILRKCGHFVGYGTLGIVFMRGWWSLLPGRFHQTWTRLRLLAGGLAVLSVTLVASADELHQSFLPNRTACGSDVALDTSGAVLLISVTSLVLLLRRRRALTQILHLRNTRHSQASSWLFRDALLERSRP